MLGIRKKEIYGKYTLKDIEELCKIVAKKNEIEIEFFQSNHEGEIIDKIHNCYDRLDGIIINPGAFTHYSYAIRDALEAVQLPVIEVHMSNVHKREEFRHKSVISAIANGVIIGFGINGYVMALDALCKILDTSEC